MLRRLAGVADRPHPGQSWPPFAFRPRSDSQAPGLGFDKLLVAAGTGDFADNNSG
jgi:hypothetical protein